MSGDFEEEESSGREKMAVEGREEEGGCGEEVIWIGRARKREIIQEANSKRPLCCCMHCSKICGVSEGIEEKSGEKKRGREKDEEIEEVRRRGRELERGDKFM